MALHFPLRKREMPRSAATEGECHRGERTETGPRLPPAVNGAGLPPLQDAACHWRSLLSALAATWPQDGAAAHAEDRKGPSRQMALLTCATAKFHPRPALPAPRDTSVPCLNIAARDPNPILAVRSLPRREWTSPCFTRGLGRYTLFSTPFMSRSMLER